MAQGRSTVGVLGLFSFLIYVFLYAPILVLVTFSFNRSRLTATWVGFTFEWYTKLLNDPQIISSLRNSLIVGVAATVISTVIGTAAALAFHRYRFKHQGLLDAMVTLPIVIPEIVLGSSLVLLFAALGFHLGFLTVIFAHVGFSLSYAVVVVRARLAGFDRSLEEASMDLGAGPTRTFFKVTLPGIAPGVLAAALLVFALSIDDYVITSFVAGVGTTTLPVQIYSMVRSGISPEINAVSTIILVATSLLLFAAYRLEQGASQMSVAAPVILGCAILGAPFFLGVSSARADQTLNLYIWSNYIAPETVHKFEKRYGVHVNVDLYDTNEALLAKVQAGNASYDLLCPSNYPIEILLHQNLLRPLDHSALPHFKNLDSRFLDKDYDRGNRYSVPYFWGTCGIGYNRAKAGAIDSWSALWDPRFKGRILMLDDARETLGATLKWKGRSANTIDRSLLEEVKSLLLQQKPLVRTYNSSNFEDILLSGDVWLAQGWNGQIAKAIDQDKNLEFVIPKEGATFFVDSLVMPANAPHPALAHQFIDFILEAETAAEICSTMHYSSPNKAALALLSPEIRGNPTIFPPEDVIDRLELVKDLGDTTVLYDRIWTEVKTSR